MTVSKAQQKATAKYVKSNYDELKIRVPKGKKQLVSDFAKSKDKSLNKFVDEAIDEKMERESGE